MTFDDWIDSIDKKRSNWMDKHTIKNLIQEACARYGVKNRNLTQQEIDVVYKGWISKEEDLAMEKDEVLERLRDMFEEELNQIKECSECNAKGKVCYENDFH